jgi:hypothetical protein
VGGEAPREEYAAQQRMAGGGGGSTAAPEAAPAPAGESMQEYAARMRQARESGAAAPQTTAERMTAAAQEAEGAGLTGKVEGQVSTHTRARELTSPTPCP